MNLGKIDIFTISSLLILKPSMALYSFELFSKMWELFFIRSCTLPVKIFSLIFYILVAIVNATLFPIIFSNWLLPLCRKSNIFFYISFVTTLINLLIIIIFTWSLDFLWSSSGFWLSLSNNYITFSFSFMMALTRTYFHTIFHDSLNQGHLCIVTGQCFIFKHDISSWFRLVLYPSLELSLYSKFTLGIFF